MPGAWMSRAVGFSFWWNTKWYWSTSALEAASFLTLHSDHHWVQNFWHRLDHSNSSIRLELHLIIGINANFAAIFQAPKHAFLFLDLFSTGIQRSSLLHYTLDCKNAGWQVTDADTKGKCVYRACRYWGALYTHLFPFRPYLEPAVEQFQSS